METKNAIHTILGATGNIGMALAKELVEYPVEIRLVSRNPVKVNPTDELFKADLLRLKEVEEAIAGSDTVYLVAGIPYKTSTWEAEWPVLMQNVITACKKSDSKLVFFDNMYCYDPAHVGKLTEESPVKPESRKGKVRASIAQMILDEINQGTLKAMIVRAADFYGPNAKSSMLQESVIKRMLEGKSAQWLYDADKKHSFTYIPDAAHATAFLAQQESAWNQVWHLPTSNLYPTGRQVVEILAKELNTRPKIQVLAGPMVSILGLFIPILREVGELRYQLDQDYCFDSSKIEQAFGLKSTDLTKGLKSCLQIDT